MLCWQTLSQMGSFGKKVNEAVGKTLSFNPGSLLRKTRDQALGTIFAIYDTKTNLAERHELI